MKYYGEKTMLSMFLELFKRAWELHDPKTEHHGKKKAYLDNRR